MSFTDEYLALQKKKKKTEQKTTKKTTGHSYTDEYLSKQGDDIAPVGKKTIESFYSSRNIAPVAKAKAKATVQEKDERKWFQKGEFEDGYQLGDITRTIIGTSDDLTENLFAGVLGFGEKAVDAGAYVVGGVGGLMGNDGLKSNMADFIKKDLYDERAVAKKIMSVSASSHTLEALGGSSETSSVLGERSDDVAYSVGQQLAVLGLQSVGVPWQLTQGVNSFGSEVENALNEGASYGRAGMSGGISAGLTVGTGALFGGSGLGEKGLINLDSVTKGIKNDVLRNLSAYGVDIVSESAEEVIEGVATALAQQKIYAGDKAFNELFSKEDFWDAVISAGVSSGVFNLPKASNSIRSGKDYRSGLTQNEQKVFDKVYADEVASAEKDGKLNKKEKASIYDKVMADMERGYIDIDTIEEVLGGESYKTYKRTVESEDALQKEFTELNRMKQSDMTGEQLDRRNELKAQLEDIKQNSKRDMYKSNLSENVFGMVKGDRLAESYNERARRGQAFEADLTKYDAKQQKTIQKAVESGVLNNTNKTHEFVEMVAKISADKGVLFDFTNNERLKESGFAVDGDAQVNGYVTKDGITLNMDSAKARNSVVGHEITHVLEGTELYTELQSAIVEYAKSKGDYQARYDSLSKLYQNVEGADVNAELTADLVGDYLFTDTDFINNLSVQHRNVFQKIYDEIKYLCKVATAGSKEARELEKVKRAFEKAYQESGKTEGAKYSLGYHAGDLGKAEGYWNMVSSNRGTGHFGTGTYFVGDEAQISDSHYGKRPHEKVEFSNYHLFKPLYEQEGFDLHSGLKYINDSISLYPIASMDFKARYGAMKKAEKAEYTFYWDDDATEAEKAEAQKTLDGLKEQFESIGYDPDNWDSEKLYEALDDISRDYRQAKSKLSMILANRGETVLLDFDSAEAKIETAIKGVYDEVSKIEDAYAARYEDSPSTRFMKALGYEGIDVRGFKGLDNTKYGSVIYDLKGEDAKRKAEIGTAKFSLSKPVEESKDLVALHNLTADKLAKSLQLGGLPMPSIAVTKADIPHSNFGDITLIFGRDTIDPKTNRKNKVYSADAWTPVFPRVEYETDSKVSNRISEKLRNLESSIDDTFQSDLRRLNYGYEDQLNRTGGEEGLVQYAMENYGLKAAYLEERGKHIDKVTKQQEAEKQYNPDSVEKYQRIMDILGVTTPEEVSNVNLKDARDQHGAELDAVYPGVTKSPMRMSRIFSAVKSYLENKDSGPVYRTVTDVSATRAAVDQALDTAGYEEWVRDLFSGIVKDSGIYNNKELFTPSGNRRSFKQTHLPVTLENIVKAMAGQNNGNSKNVSGFNGVKTLRAATAETFKSVDHMHQRGDRLQNKTQEEVDALHDELQTRLYNVMEAIDTENGKRGESNPYIRLDSIGENLTEIGESGKFGIADIQAVFRQYGKVVSDDTALEVKQLLYDVSQMPVNLFEAKPERVVSFDEAKVFVIPNNADVKLKQELLNRGYSIAEYDPNIEGHRQQVVNQFEQYKFSLSRADEQFAPTGSLRELKLEAAPVPNTDSNTQPVSNTDSNTVNALDGDMFPDDLAPMADDPERLNSLTDADMPPEMDAPYTEDGEVTVDDPFEERDWYKVGNRKVNAYMYENPEVKPYFQEEAAMLLAELKDSVKGEKWFDGDLYYQTGGEQGWGGTKRYTSDSIAEMLDTWGMSYADIEKGLNAILEDNGAENIAAAKKIEFMLNERLLNGYKDFYSNDMIPANEEYVKLLNEKQITEYSTEAFDAFMANADQYAPPVEDIAPVAKPVQRGTYQAAPVEKYEAIRPKREKQPRMARATPAEQARAEILVDEPKVEQKKKNGLWNWAKVNLLDPGTVFETLSLKSGNPELQAKFSSIKRAESRAQRHMENGNGMSSSLKSIREGVEKTGKTKQFYEYLYHMHNADRMTLEDRYMDVENKPVFGSSITADISALEVAELERKNPEFKRLAQEVYNYMGNLREMLVEGGVISRETAQLWQEMYPHYVPIRREGHDGVNINVPLDSRKTGINAPIKRATGGNSNILPLFDTMAQRTIQTYKAIAKNRFGVELKNTIGHTIESEAAGVDEVIDSIDTHEELLQAGKNGMSPTFTVFENGERVTFEITDEMYDAMKPKSGAATLNSKVLNKVNDVRRGLITEYNPVFAVTNPIKDIQDVLINSKHPARTYANMPKAIGELLSNGHWYQEYLDNGGEQNTYFEGETNTFVKEKSALRKVVGFPLDKLSQVNNFIEKVPRLAEYIASRKAGRSIDVSMLDAARVTTDFSAGGHITKMMNRNGFTFLNASVQGAVQQVRNVREAKYNGLKGWAQLAGKAVVAGLPAMLLNHLLWDDDEEYEELSDYVKQNYYIVGKFGDGKFVRIPKGRTVAVIQNAIEQMENLITGNDEADLGAFTELVISNLAPSNPLDNNIIAPIAQAWRNETWYGEDLVPTRLADLPSAEQYDESTDAISRWLGERTPFSPYKINYLLDQYSGGIGDTFLPMLTPEAESGNNTFVGNLLAPWKDKFTTDAVMNNQNVSDFYDKKDELTVNANAAEATEEDVLMSKYLNSVNAEMSKLYAEKRKIQNSDLPDAEKYAAVRDVQKQIVELSKEGLDTYGDISFEDDYREGGEYARVNDRLYKLNDEGEWSKLSDDQVTKYEVTKAAGNASYATDGTNHYRWYVPGEDADKDTKPGWRKVTDKELEKQHEVTKGLGISPETYWSDREEYGYAFEHPENYAVAKAVGGYEAFRGYSSELYDIKADKDSNGKSISGSRKEKVLDYVNGLDIDYGEKLILFKSEYNADDTYNYEIIDYLNSREDISYEEMATILKKLGFTVSANGDISW
jgi:hypothetical protein